MDGSVRTPCVSSAAGLEEAQFQFNLEENVAVVAVGEGVAVHQHLTNDFARVRKAVGTFTKI